MKKIKEYDLVTCQTHACEIQLKNGGHVSGTIEDIHLIRTLNYIDHEMESINPSQSIIWLQFINFPTAAFTKFH